MLLSLIDSEEVEPRYTLIQYLFSGKEHEVTKILPHGNSKPKTGESKPYKRLMASTREALQNSIKGDKTVKFALDKVYCSVGDVTKAQSSAQLPRGPRDIYSARYAAKKNAEKANEVQGIWELLEKARREEKVNSDSAFIRECVIHPDFLVILATDRQLRDLKNFCTNPSEFCVFGADPTFNIFEENISLTVTTY